MNLPRWALLVLVAGCGAGTASTVDPSDGGADGGLPDAAGDAGAPPDGGSPPDGGGRPDGGAPDSGGPITTQPTNILNNGGFEYGLMCFSNWVWSTTGQDYKGDYDFELSSDAHSGAWSLNIRCTGADCEKAAIYTERIPTTPGQGYRVTLWTKCPSGTRAFFNTDDASTGELVQDLVCNGAWASNTVTFSVASSRTQFTFYIYNGGAPWLLVDDVVLTLADGTVPQKTVKHPGARDVRVEGKSVFVDGAPYLALGFYNVPGADLPAVQAMGGNTVTGLAEEAVCDCYNTEGDSYPDRAFELGIGVAPDSTTSSRLDNAEVFAAITERFGPHLANVAWVLVDEPDQANVPWYTVAPTTLVAEFQSAKTRTSLPIFADFQHADWDTADATRPYRDGVDGWMAEPYGDGFGGLADAIKNFDAIAEKPIWLAQDPVSANLVVPKAWWAIVRGATGILYFTWGAFQADSAQLAAAEQAFGELSSLKAAIFGQDLGAQVTGPAGVGFIARAFGGKTYVMAVNPSGDVVSGSFTVPSTLTQATVLFEGGAPLGVSNGQFEVTFDGVSRHVYEIE